MKPRLVKRQGSWHVIAYCGTPVKWLQQARAWAYFRNIVEHQK